VDDTTEEEAFEQNYFEVKSLLKRFAKVPTEGTEFSSTNAIVQLLQQQSEMISHMRGTQNDVSGDSPLVKSNTLSAIFSQQTEILNRVAITAGQPNLDTRIKLPTIKLSRFDGKIEEWKCFFYYNFRSIIHDKVHLSDIEKFQYLMSSISSDAAKIIESIELTSQNYRTAWELLQQ